MLYLKDAYLRGFDATVTSVEASGRRVCLDCTAFYATGGGQPHDTGTLGGHSVIDVRKEGEFVWHTVGGDGPLPRPGDAVHGELDWDRRHALMRTHTALHVLCGVIWNEWGKAVTGGNMEPLSARMDFEFDPLPEGFGARVEELVNSELRAARPIQVSFLPRDTAVLDRDLIRTKVSLIPESVNGDPGRRHRRARQASRRWDPRRLHRRGGIRPGAQDRVQGQSQQAHPTRSAGRWLNGRNSPGPALQRRAVAVRLFRILSNVCSSGWSTSMRPSGRSPLTTAAP